MLEVAVAILDVRRNLHPRLILYGAAKIHCLLRSKAQAMRMVTITETKLAPHGWM